MEPKSRSHSIYVVIIISVILFHLVHCTSNGEGKVVKKLLADYSTEERPVKMANMSAEISFGFKLNSFLDLQMKNEVMDTILWITLTWKDKRLAWDPTMYNGTTSVSIPAKKLWMPDIVLYNSAEDTLSSSTSDVKTKVSVKASGDCTLIAPLKYKSMCSVKVKNFPYDVQRCDLIFGSWTLDKTQLSIKKLNPNAKTYLSEEFNGNGQWYIKKIETKTEDKFYSCCKNPYSQFRVTFHFKRKPLYFLLYLILPCVLVSILILLVFIIPPSSGERLGLGITVILNMSVYLLVVSDNLPESSDESPLLGVFYVVMIYEMTIAFILSGLTLWISSWQTELPEIINKIFFFKWPKRKSARKILGESDNRSYHIEKGDQNDLRCRATANKPQEEEKVKRTESAQSVVQGDGKSPILKKTWEDVGRKLDKILFFFFLALFLLTSLGTIYVRPDVHLGKGDGK